MSFSLVTDYPAWFFVFCLLAGAGYSFMLYWRERRFDEVPKWLRLVLPAVRFVAVSVIAFFLLSPLLKNVSRTVEKPILIFAQDNSGSVVFNKDSSFYNGKYKEEIAALVSSLADKYDTVCYTFGDNINRSAAFDFSEKQTDISSLFNELETRYSNRNVGAVILASDGLYNKGQNPVYVSDRHKYPVYAIALGDTSVRRDLALTKVLHNRIAYLGNKFPLEVQLSSRQLAGKTTVCTVSRGEEVLFTQQVVLSGNNFSASIPVLLDAKETGLQRYLVRLSCLDGEVTCANNSRDVFIDVLDGRQKVLILAAAPHPDVSAIRNAIASNENFEVVAALVEDFNGRVSDHNLVILHQLPSHKDRAEKVFAEINSKNIPVWFIQGGQTSAAHFNQLQQDIELPSSAGKMNDVMPVLSKNFSLFTLSDPLRTFISKVSPLQCPFGSYKAGSAGSSLFTQRIGLVETDMPLFYFSQSGDQKRAVTCGEGMWRWSLQDYAEHKSTSVFNELITKTVQYLSAKTDKSLFRVISKNNFYENEAVEFDAEVYNDSYELINTPDVSVNITSDDGKSYPFTFSKTVNAYRLNAGLFPPGSYRYEAKVSRGGKVFSEKGEFSVSLLQAEITNTVADHQLLYALSRKSGGEMIYPNGIGQLTSLLNAREDIKPVSHSEKKLSDLVNLRWIFFLLLSLLALEWFIRKINGAY